MRTTANNHRRDVNFEVDDKMLLKLQQYCQHSVARPLSVKLARHFYGPFEVLERIGPVAYKLHLPEGSRIHNVFHVSLLRPFVEGSAGFSTDFSPLFARGKPVIRPVLLAARRTVWRDGEPVEEGQLLWEDDEGSKPTWEPLHVIRRCLPWLLLEDKEVSSRGS